MNLESGTIPSVRTPQALKTPTEVNPTPRFDHAKYDESSELTHRPPAYRMVENTALETAVSSERRRPITVVVVDSNRAVAELLGDCLSHHSWVEGIRVCDTVAEALQWIGAASVPLIVSEVSFRDQTGFYLAQEARRQCPNAKIAIWADRLSDSMLDQFLRLPVQGGFLKQDSLASLVTGLANIAQGKTHFSTLVRQRFVDGVARPGAVRGAVALKGFSPRHLNVLLRLAEGDSVKMIAMALGVSVKTIDCLKYRMMKQLQLHDRVELARWAIGEGLITA